MRVLLHCLLIGAGGFAGAVLRYLIGLGSGLLLGQAFPVGTMVINLSGSLFLGWFLTVVSDRVIVSEATRLAVATGFVGAYTTFSTWTYESNRLMEEGAYVRATVNVVGSVVLGLIAVRLGVGLARRF